MNLSTDLFESIASDPNLQGTIGYLRFSIMSNAQQSLHLASEEFMGSLFSTTVADALGSDLGSQQIANCYQVPKYVELHV